MAASAAASCADSSRISAPNSSARGSGFSECLHQELHPRELVFGVTGHLPDSTGLSPRTFWNFTREFSSVISVVFRADQSGMSAIVVVLHPAQRQPAGVLISRG